MKKIITVFVAVIALTGGALTMNAFAQPKTTQAEVVSPVPTVTPLPTDMPTPTITPFPTNAPTVIPVQTAPVILDQNEESPEQKQLNQQKQTILEMQAQQAEMAQQEQQIQDQQQMQQIYNSCIASGFGGCLQP